VNDYCGKGYQFGGGRLSLGLDDLLLLLLLGTFDEEARALRFLLGNLNETK
jgi:hypothetical protein